MRTCLNTDQLSASVATILTTARSRHARASMTLLLAGAQSLPALAQEARTLDAVGVVGTGSTRTTASISVDEIQAQVPGVAPQQLLASLPGVKHTRRLLDDRLTMAFGAKGLDVKRDYNGIANLDDFTVGVRHAVTIKNSDWFQPQVGASFQLAEGVQVFANDAENFSSAPRLTLTSGAFHPDIAPEESTNIDIGIRAEFTQWSGYIAAYKIDDENRIIALTDPRPAGGGAHRLRQRRRRADVRGGSLRHVEAGARLAAGHIADLEQFQNSRTTISARSAATWYR
ncbi:TonB-dependent receptor [Xanthomonas oryzae]|uniref:TonB-dependent receptor n=1 Tax=Xanthomonas oryzae TaxID=347 RepID=UPI0030D77986